MNIPEEDRPIAILKMNIKKRPWAVPQVTAWLRKTADYIDEHQTNCSNHLTTRLFAVRPRKSTKVVGLDVGIL